MQATANSYALPQPPCCPALMTLINSNSIWWQRFSVAHTYILHSKAFQNSLCSLVTLTGLCVSQASASINWNSPYSLADGHSFFRHGLGVGHVVLHDGLEELVFVLSVKRWLKRKTRMWSWSTSWAWWRLTAWGLFLWNLTRYEGDKVTRRAEQQEQLCHICMLNHCLVLVFNEIF